MSKILPDMNLNDLAEADRNGAVEMEVTHFGGATRKIYVVDREIPYPDGRLIVSRTDANGIITQANRAFVDMSGYDEDELIGQPHCILRHPDIPSAIFQDMWEHIKTNRSWYGYVKNLRKDGCYYWVYASVNPTYRDGELVAVTSVRRKPARDKVAETIEQIKEL